MKYHTRGILAAFALLALPVGAITTTLEYEDARQLADRQAATTYTDAVALELSSGIVGLESSKVSTNDFTAATNELAAVLAQKADTNKYLPPTLTTADLWRCDWSGEVLPLRLATPRPIWQKAYNETPALFYSSSPVFWGLNTESATVLTITTTNETATALDFGNGYTMTRLGPLVHAVYSDELATAIADAEPGDYANVSNKAVTALQSYDETDPNVPSWAKASAKPSYTLNEVAPNSENWIGVQGNAGRYIKILAQTIAGIIQGGITITASTQNDNNRTTYMYGGVAVRRNGTTADYLWDTTSQNGIVRRKDLAGVQPGNYSAVSNAAMSASESIAAVAAYLNGDDARVVITNYDSVVHMPSLSFEQKITNVWHTIWDERTRWDWLTGQYLPINYYSKALVDALLEEKADRAWGFYDSHTGNYAPDGYTWVSSPKIAIAGGLAYQRTVTAEGAVWVLESNGLVAETGGVVSNGFFRISDDEGNALLEIVKGDKRVVGAQANSVRTSASYAITHLYIDYNVVSEQHPVLHICNDLAAPDWKAETDSGCLANVTWTGTSGAYTAEVWGKTAQAALFVKAEYEIGGETYIKNAAPIGFEYIMLGGHKYAVGTAVISGNTVLTLTLVN